MENILTLLSNYLFPVVACVVLYVELAKTRESHGSEMKLFKESLDNNTAALNEIKGYLQSGRF